jgi:diguanylate cyclase (GGDEF)-like protein/putative nucleotidyltransferase with HDIG domain
MRPMTIHLPVVLRRPRLLAFVYLTTLAIVMAASGAFVWIVSGHVTDAAIDASVQADQSLLRAFVQTLVLDEDLSLSTGDAARAKVLEAELASLVQPGGILRLKLWAPDGTILLSDVPQLRGQKFELEDDLMEAFQGGVSTDISSGTEGEERAEDALPAEKVVGEYLPVFRNGQIPAVFEVYRDAGPILARVDASRRDLILFTLLSIAGLAVVLRLIFKAASDRLERQTAALVEATRRDGLTGLLNHGAIVAELAGKLEKARSEGGAIAIGLLDLDNFRALNDNHGHPAGDEALRRVARVLREELADRTPLGRFGPDEFLAIAPPEVANDLEPAIERLRIRLATISLQFGSSERLPVTVSAAIAEFPVHADATTELLSVATVALGEAKASGGDAVRVAHPAEADRRVAESRSFDVLKGLIIAVDTKDRYTVRHSEDVARYATFLAERIGLDPEQRRTLRVAGLLHDVGKIGVPDAILRKPAALTSSEYDIVKQHVALGHLIVRDMANLEQVRAGIRYHHERWDGTGYLDRLGGEEIPLIARLLSVADAFSAMTSSRPYRQALDIREALKRLEDGAETQFDPTLVKVFVAGIETAEDAPMPGIIRPGMGAWSILEGAA